MANTYCTTYCNQGHDIRTGRPVGHECYVLPVRALKAERDGNFELAIQAIAEAKPLQRADCRLKASKR